MYTTHTAEEIAAARIQRAEEILAKMRKAWDAGGYVLVCTYTHVTELHAKHAHLVTVTPAGLMMQRGRKRIRHDSIQYCGFRFFYPIGSEPKA
jgi:hypothetical protein